MKPKQSIESIFNQDNEGMTNPFIVQSLTVLGRTVGRYRPRVFGIHQNDRLFHTYIVGQTGTGKSNLLLNMLRQDIEHGRGFCLLDPHGDLAKEAAKLLGDRGIYWEPSDPDCNYGYNPLTYVAARYRPLVASSIIDTLKQQWSDAWGVRMEHLLRFTLLALLERPSSTISDIVPMFTTKSFRAQVLSHVTDTEVLKFWKDEFPNMNYKNAFDGVAPIANKLGAFLSHHHVRKALTDPVRPIRFRTVLDNGTPMIVNLSKGSLGNDISNVLGGLIVSMLTSAAFTRAEIDEEDRRPFFLYADEFHSFTTHAFAGMLSQLRKYSLGLVLAHQFTTQLEPQIFESILGNVGTLIVFRVGAKDAPILSKQLGQPSSRPAHINAAHLAELPNYRCFMKLMIKGAQSGVFSATTFKL
ncbi:type IV secretion system DNA-binding domain-containing protein [Hoeflea sp. AS60]|uniref:type IV secretory system conjugative DNA transfer family protein n=1 Tax=Hoeflea sp. AS60 TaxID=3135780 RepID=UPI003181EE3B